MPTVFFSKKKRSFFMGRGKRGMKKIEKKKKKER